MKVGVKEIANENYVDRTQRYVFVMFGFWWLESVCLGIVARGSGVHAGSRGAERGLGRTWANVCCGCWSSLLVRAWNYSSLPGYKGGFWNKEAQGSQRVEARKP